MGLATKTISKTLSSFIPCSSMIFLISSFIPSMTTPFKVAKPFSSIMQYETLLITSSPYLICGFIIPILPIILPEFKSQRVAAIEVEPKSIANPNAGISEYPE